VIKLKGIELSAPFKLEKNQQTYVSIRVPEHCKALELNENSGIVTITTLNGSRIFTSMSNVKAAYEHESEASGNTTGTKKPTAKAS
jgi:tRNA A37 threonylcarbamoyladenosine synthetase subunit TsaC/SUA5/YrdC